MDSFPSQASPTPRRKSKGAAYYRSLFEEQSRRGISMKQLAAERGIPYTTLTHWSYRFRNEEGGMSKPPKLVPVKVIPLQVTTPQVTAAPEKPPQDPSFRIGIMLTMRRIRSIISAKGAENEIHS